VTNIAQTGATTFSTGTGNLSFNGNIITNIAQTGATTFSTGTGAVTLNGATTISGANTFATGTGNISLNGNVVTNIAQTGATTFSTGTGNISLNGNIVTNIAQTGATTFGTGTGAVSLNGATTVTGANTFTVNGGATTLKAGATVTGGNLVLGSAVTGPVHIRPLQQTAPTLTNGTGSTCTLVAGTNNDVAGELQVVVTTTGVSVPICTVTFNAAYTTAPIVVITPGNAATATWFRTANTNPFVTTTTTTWVLQANTTAQGAGTYLIYYQVIE